MIMMITLSSLLRPVSVIGLSSMARLSSAPANELIVDSAKYPGVAVILLNRPKAKNAFSKSLVSALEAAFKAVGQEKSLRAVVIGSAAKGIFCAGADLKERATMAESEVGPFVARARALIQELSELPMPTIAALDGPALGGGLELALACDLRVSSADALMGLVETRLAIIPGAGGTQRLPRIIGTSRAKELMFTAKTVSGTEAHRIGLVNSVVEQNSGGSAALEEAIKIASTIAQNGPVALRMAKKAINEGVEVSLKASMAVEAECYATVIPTKDRIEGLTAFREKRKPVYTGS